MKLSHACDERESARTFLIILALQLSSSLINSKSRCRLHFNLSFSSVRSHLSKEKRKTQMEKHCTDNLLFEMWFQWNANERAFDEVGWGKDVDRKRKAKWKWGERQTSEQRNCHVHDKKDLTTLTKQLKSIEEDFLRHFSQVWMKIRTLLIIQLKLQSISSHNWVMQLRRDSITHET